MIDLEGGEMEPVARERMKAVIRLYGATLIERRTVTKEDVYSYPEVWHVLEIPRECRVVVFARWSPRPNREDLRLLYRTLKLTMPVGIHWSLRAVWRKEP